jgi:acyl-CoA synthetase (AMP-forming)/AMP-acid ligase II
MSQPHDYCQGSRALWDLTHNGGYPDDSHPEWWMTVGKPLPRVEVKVIDPESEEVVPIGTVGEVCTRSSCVMKGYFRNPEATSLAIDGDGWLRTGDLGSMDANARAVSSDGANAPALHISSRST